MTRAARAVVALAVLTLAAGEAPAQPLGGLELGAGVGILHDADLSGDVAAGWFVEGGWRLSPRVALVGEAGRHRLTESRDFLDTEATFAAVLGGVRVRLAFPRWQPYAHVLAGVTRATVVARATVPVPAFGEDRATHATLQVGGGLELPLPGPLWLRLGADYRRILRPAPLDQLRACGGVTFRF